MPAQVSEVLRHLRRAELRQDDAAPGDAQLLARFLEQCDEVAVTALVRRHGPMVWGVCRRVLGNHHDAEDAFQATFLILVRKAASIRQHALVGHWLYRVAHRTARKARATRARRSLRERSAAVMPEPAAIAAGVWSDLLPLFDQELTRLPDRYQTAIVLCDLEGKSAREVAQQLGVPYGTVTSRLTRGRAMLAKRLARHWLPMTAGALTTLLSDGAAAARVPAAVFMQTHNGVTAVAGGQATTAGLIPARVAVLVEGVLKAMQMSKLKAVLAICLGVAVLALGGASNYQSLAAGGGAAPGPAPQTRPDRLADMLILLDKQLWQATSNHDVETIGKILADDWDCQKPKWTRADSLELYKQHRYVEVNIVGERQVYRIDKHTALMSYESKWRAVSKGPERRESHGHNRTIHCWVKRDGGWVIKHTETVSLLSATESAPAPLIVPFPGLNGRRPGLELFPRKTGT
jgi:RNA polymerase sigma factor (sigma-70 family)